MEDMIATSRRQTLFYAVLTVAALICACAAPGQGTAPLPGSGLQNYPPVIEDTPQRRQAAFEAWKKLIAEFQLPEVRLDLEPVLNTPRALPPEMSGRNSIQTKAGAFGELEA